MKHELQKVFGELSSKNHIKYNKSLYTKLSKFLINYQTSGDKGTFFGGVLMGVVNVYFTDRDRLELFNVLGFHIGDVMNIIERSQCLNNEYKRESDATNNILLYVAHRFFTEPSLKKKYQLKYAAKVMEIYYTRQYAIILSDQLQFNTPTAVAKKVYESLSRKFILRKLGSWQKVMEYRGHQFVNSVAREPILKHYLCDGIKDAISAARGDVQSTIKRIYSSTVAAYNSSSKIASTSMKAMGEDGENIIDKVDNNSYLVEKIEKLFSEGDLYIDNAFIITKNILHTVRQSSLSRCIDFITDPNLRTNRKISKETVDLLKDTVHFNARYLKDKDMPVDSEHLYLGFQTLKRLLTSSSSRADLIDLRERYETLFKRGNINLTLRQKNITIAAVQLYIFIVATTA